MSESGGVKEYSFNEPVQLQEWYDVGADIRVNLRKQFGALTKELNKLQLENQGLREQITTLKSDLLRAEFFKREMEDSNFYLRQTINKKDAEIEKLKTELTFTKEYLNPADTSFRQMIDAFRVFPKEKQDKLVELSRALVAFQSGGGEKSP